MINILIKKGASKFSVFTGSPEADEVGGFLKGIF